MSFNELSPEASSGQRILLMSSGEHEQEYRAIVAGFISSQKEARDRAKAFYLATNELDNNQSLEEIIENKKNIADSTPPPSDEAIKQSNDQSAKGEAVKLLTRFFEARDEGEAFFAAFTVEQDTLQPPSKEKLAHDHFMQGLQAIAQEEGFIPDDSAKHSDDRQRLLLAVGLQVNDITMHPNGASATLIYESIPEPMVSDDSASRQPAQD